MKANIKLSLYRLSVLALLALLRNVVAKMTGNANFATPAVSLVDMTAQGDTLEAAIEAATNGSKEAMVVRDEEVARTRAMLRIQADYVRTVCAGDKAKLVTSGFELASTPEPVGLPGIPVIHYVRMTGEKGQVEVRWSKQRAESYNVYRTQDDPKSGAKWTHVGTTTKTRCLVDELESYTPYWYAVRAIGAAGTSGMSDPAIGVAA